MTQMRRTPELTTLCYLEDRDRYLMLHRVKKKNDVNHDRWIGVGGHIEFGESPEECILRETKEETGLSLTSFRLRGAVTFVSDRGDFEYMFLFTADGFTGTPHACSEGELEWLPKEKVFSLNLWEGDRIFFRLLAENAPFFSLKLHYDEKDTLREAVLDGKALELFDILNEDGTKSGIVRERGVAHRDGSLHQTVHLWIARKKADGTFDLLLQKRSENKDCYPGCWDISSAGHVPAGETREQAVLRELSEELGVVPEDPSEIRDAGPFRIAFDDVFHGQPFCDREIAELCVWIHDLDLEGLPIQREELTEVRWFPFSRCLQMAKDRSLLPNCLVYDELLRVEGALAESSQAASTRQPESGR